MPSLALFIGSAPYFAITPEEAKALSEKASACIMEAGEEKAFADFTRSDGGFVDGGLRVFCYDREGIAIKTGFDQGSGWVDFRWPDPVAKEIQTQSAYAIRTNDVVCGVGHYKE